MLKQKITIIILLLLVVTGVRAQQEPSFAHYWAMEPSFNPAAVGKQSKLNVTGAYAMTLTGFENAPKTMHFAADMPFFMMGHYHGVGLQLVNDQLGLFSHQRLLAQYAFKQPLLGGVLSIGVQGGVLSEKFRGSGLDLENSNDPAFSKSDVSGVAIDLSAGLYYTHRQWFAGISILHATSPSIELGDRSILDVSSTYYLTAGYNIQLRNPLLSIHPSVLAHTEPCQYDDAPEVHARAEDDVCWSGLQSLQLGDSAHRRLLPRHHHRLQLRGIHLCTEDWQRQPRVVCGVPDGSELPEEGTQPSSERTHTLIEN